MKPNHSKIQIINPCSTSWDDMKIDSVGRFCDSCMKSVVDFTFKSDSEIKSYLLERKDEQICGRFYKAQVDRIRIEIDEKLLYSSIPFWQKFLVIVLVCFGSDVLGYDFCFAQTENDSLPLKTELADSLVELVELDSTIVDQKTAVDSIPKRKIEQETVCVPFLGIIVSGSVSITEPQNPNDHLFPEFAIDKKIEITDVSESIAPSKEYRTRRSNDKKPLKDKEPPRSFIIASLDDQRKKKK